MSTPERRRASGAAADRLPDRDHPRPNGPVVILLVVDGRSSADLRSALLDLHVQDGGGLQLLAMDRAQLLPASRVHALHEILQHLLLGLGVLHLLRLAEQHHRAIIDRVMEGGARQHEPVDVRHRYAGIHAAFEAAQHARGARAVPVHLIALAPVVRRGHVRLAVDDVADMAQEPGVENGVDRREVVVPPLGQALDAGTGCLAELGLGGHRGLHAVTPIGHVSSSCVTLCRSRLSLTPPRRTRSSPSYRTPRHSVPARADRSSSPCGRRTARDSPRPR